MKRSDNLALAGCALVFLGCSNSGPTTDLSESGGAKGSGVVTGVGGQTGAGTGGAVAGGGTGATGGSTRVGGTLSTVGGAATGGVPSAGGAAASGGVSTGGAGASPSGGQNPAGGTLGNTGGATSTSTTRATGGAVATGGVSSTGGTVGTTASGGSGSAGTGGRTGGVTGGAGASGGTGEVAGAGAYRPCPTNGTPCKILPFGDSITRGAKSSDDAGYRSQLFKLIVAANQKITFTGSLTNGPTLVSGQTFPRKHEGHSGWTISQLSPLLPTPALNDKPNIILLHIGTNDIGSRDPAGMATRLEALVDKTAQNGPDALIVLAQITPAFTDNDIRDAYNAMIPGIVQSHAAKGQHIIGVNMNKLPTSGLSSDGVHPNDQGYAYMAGIWYAAIKDLLPK